MTEQKKACVDSKLFDEVATLLQKWPRVEHLVRQYQQIGYAGESILSDVQLELARYVKKNGCVPPGGIKWLYVTARSRCVDHIRSHRSRERGLSKFVQYIKSQLDFTRNDPMMLAEKEDNIKIIQESLPALSDSDREIIFFRIYEGWGYSDIAEVLSINEDAARKRFERALWNLELILKKRGIVQEHVS